MTAVTIDNQYNNTLTSEGAFKIIKFTVGTGSLPGQTLALGSAGSGRTWLGLGANSAGGTAILYSISGVTATFVAAPGVADAEVCTIKLTKY